MSRYAEVFDERAACFHLFAEIAKLELGLWNLHHLSKACDKGRKGFEPFDGLLGIFLIVPADQTEHLKLVAASPRRPLFCIVPSGAKRIISGMKSFVAEESQDEQQEDDSKCC